MFQMHCLLCPENDQAQDVAVRCNSLAPGRPKVPQGKGSHLPPSPLYHECSEQRLAQLPVSTTFVYHIGALTSGRRSPSGRLGLGAKPGRRDPGEGLSPGDGVGKRHQAKRKS